MDDVTQAVTSLKAATDIAKALLGIRDTTMIDAKVSDLLSRLIEAQNGLLHAQAQQTALIQEKHDLEKQIVEMKRWDVERQRYQLTCPWPGAYVYAAKEVDKGTEPPHWICEHCYQEGRKSFLQNTHKGTNRRVIFVKCFHCNLELETHDGAQTERKYV